jgi:Domain of unknown function (DUF6504)
MVRRYEEPIEVRARAGELSPCGASGDRQDAVARAGEDGEQVPTAFLWRGRLYVVRDVLAHWSQRRPWWREALDPREDADLSGEPGHLTDPATGGSGASVVGSLRTAAELEQDVWRVEASPGRLHQAGVYDLAREGGGDAGGRWRLLRVAD